MFAICSDRLQCETRIGAGCNNFNANVASCGEYKTNSEGSAIRQDGSIARERGEERGREEERIHLAIAIAEGEFGKICRNMQWKGCFCAVHSAISDDTIRAIFDSSFVAFLFRKRANILLNTIICRMPMLNFNHGFRGRIIWDCKIRSLNFKYCFTTLKPAYEYHRFLPNALNRKYRKNFPNIREARSIINPIRV